MDGCLGWMGFGAISAARVQPPSTTSLSPPICHSSLPLCSCYEIYGGKVFDLLNGRKKLEVREDGRKRVQVRLVW